MKIEKAASVAPSTVTKYSKGQLELPKAPRTVNRKTFTVRNIKVDPRVWRAAKRLARGDMKRLRVISATEVIVMNPREA